MTGRNPSDTPAFDSHVMNTLDEPGVDRNDGGSNQQQQQPSGDNRQPTPVQQPNADGNIDDVIARTDGIKPVDPNAQQQPDPNKQQQQQQQPQKKLVDDQGNPIPNNQRHHFLNMKKAEKLAHTVTQENNQLKTQLAAFQHVHQVIQNSGLTPQEQAVGITLAQGLKKDPLKTATNLLTELKSAGINIDGAIGVGGIDTDSIAKLIDNKLKPITERFQNERQQQEHNDAIAADVHGFFEDYPEAQLHAEPLNNILKAKTDWTLDQAWAELRVVAAQNGLDMNKPLAPQIVAKRGGTQTQNRTVNGNGGTRVPMTSPGRANATQLQQPQGKSFDHNARSRDIVLESMREAGMDITRLQ